MEQDPPPPASGGGEPPRRRPRAIWRRGRVWSTPAVVAVAVVVLAGTSGTVLLARDAGGGQSGSNAPVAIPGRPSAAPAATASATAATSGRPSPAAGAGP